MVHKQNYVTINLTRHFQCRKTHLMYYSLILLIFMQIAYNAKRFVFVYIYIVFD